MRRPTIPAETPGGKPKDPDRININEEWELRFWARELGLSEDQLKQAVEEVGVLTTELRRYRPPH
jgi:hypothetical protein